MDCGSKAAVGNQMERKGETCDLHPSELSTNMELSMWRTFQAGRTSCWSLLARCIGEDLRRCCVECELVSQFFRNVLEVLPGAK